ncbi:hypothetical protein [Candidatus Endoriftia persephone]|jgi:hypothetical protein|uniref:Uncharacterized protein n=3 Tax=Gammaproteobacteria TaxID=1236 RepID=G2FIV3_9GAMM|nr:hypothetical protein [Candidatus Endoriftia persephone]EGV51404.1 hypothetical protein Rifp1Sym_bk00070 [endosymbiont of Riftia pachyptila (vent Ph05)]EGW53288.1 hypothetical protein TevJSym_bg00240 [endosymbiont of Tevnia jerichonana (vent Tica)]USF87791.1 hypothetical protein L0Y14_00660 [Candidatus Endoriftia persephone]
MAGPPLPSKEELAQLSPEALTIYAGRSALRVLPLIANQGTVESWGSEAQQKLQVVELAAALFIAALTEDTSSYQYDFGGEYPEESAVAMVSAAAPALARGALNAGSGVEYIAARAISAAAYAAGTASRAVATASVSPSVIKGSAFAETIANPQLIHADSDFLVYADLAVARGREVAVKTFGAGGFERNVRVDFEALIKARLRDMLSIPLWPAGEPDNWGDFLAPWEKALRMVDPEVWDRYQQWLGGGGSLREEYHRLIGHWSAEHEREVMEAAAYQLPLPEAESEGIPAAVEPMPGEIGKVPVN